LSPFPPPISVPRVAYLERAEHGVKTNKYIGTVNIRSRYIDSVYHSRVAFLRQLFKVWKGIFWAISYMASVGRKVLGFLLLH